MSNALIIEHVGNAVVVTFNRPEQRSPLSVSVLEQLQIVVDDAVSSEKLIFTGVREVFASGADLREIANVTPETAREFSLRGQKLMQSVADLKCRTIAAVNGYCFGGALDLSLACDIRIASPGAEFSHPGANLGIMTGWGGTQRMPRFVGEAAALEMFFTAKRVDANEAMRIGLIDMIAADPLAAALAI